LPRFFNPMRRGRHLDLESAVARSDFQGLPGLEAESVAQRLGDDDPARASMVDFMPEMMP
jgi:hypothetical protein